MWVFFFFFFCCVDFELESVIPSGLLYTFVAFRFRFFFFCVCDGGAVEEGGVGFYSLLLYKIKFFC